MKKIYFNEAVKEILHGGDYNPEQWKDYPEILEEDIRLMEKAGMNSSTIGIFSWATLEPEEGKYDFSFMDETIEKLERIHAKIVLATPSGARPRWLAEKYPEVLRTNRQGIKDPFKTRHNHCFTSPVYREKVQSMNRKLAERYGNKQNIVLWHISNELEGECCCPLCYQAFQKYLKEKFNGDLDKLNHEWWTPFWSHTYTSWDQIEPIDRSVHGLEIEWKRFVAHQTIDFYKNETIPFRELTPNIPITTNLRPYWDIDTYALGKELDVVCWDNYPKWHTPSRQAEIASEAAFWHDYYRSVQQKPFLMMESTPSSANWHTYNKLKRPGMHKLSSLQAVAHGSDSVQYFQWRKSRGSVEKFHGAVVDHQGTENTRVFKEVAELGNTLKKLGKVTGTNVSAEVAILIDTGNMWGLEQCEGYNLSQPNKNYQKTFLRIHHAFWKLGVNVDIVFHDSDFSKYKLIAAPMLYMMSEQMIEKLEEYVKNGGTLLSGYITGVVNENDLCYLGGFPAGKLKDVFGLWAEETDALYPDEQNEVVTTDGKAYAAIDYCEVIHPSTAEILATFKEDFYKDCPAVCRNSYGKGKALYVAFRDKGDYTDDLCNTLVNELHIIRNVLNLPHGVSAHTRCGDDDEFLFLENYTKTEQIVTINGVYTDMETGEEKIGALNIAPYTCIILHKTKRN